MKRRSTSVFRRFFVGQAARLALRETDGKRAACPTIARGNATLRARSESGVALILTLAILALVTLLLIAFVTSMRVENAASKNFNDLIKARELAQAGVDEAVGIIRLAAPPVSLVTNYVTAPGAIYMWSPTIPGSTHWTNVALFTSDPSNLTGNPNLTNDGNEVDLNANNVITGVSLTYPTNNTIPHLWVGWSNVVATVNGVNQLVGRYAYWVDDESAKVNLNIAGSRGNDLEGWTTGGIDLLGLGPPNAGFQSSLEVANLTNYIQNTRPLDTIQSMVMAVPPLVGIAPSVSGATFSNTQFSVTTHSTSPDITPWGTKRVNLSNIVANAASKAAAVPLIVNALSVANIGTWFGGQTFASKYNNLQQIAANIVDYITTDNTPTDNGTFGDQTAPAFLGLKETPYLNELVISNTFQVQNLGSGTYQLNINSYPLVELWYMYTNSAGWTALPNTSVSILNNGANPLSISVKGGGFNPAGPFAIPAVTTIKNGFTSMTPNSFLVVPPSASTPMLTEAPTLSAVASPLPPTITVTLSGGTITAIFTSQQPGNKGRMDYAVIGFGSKTYNIPTSGTLVSALWASQCNDPRVKPISNTWAQNLGATTLGAQNSSPTYNLTAGSGTITGDGDTSCHIISANLGTTGGRQRGTMTPGEMAFIHTGLPWRTFWLEPQPSTEQSAGLIPDWAILDLFSSTDATDTIGRININQRIADVASPPGRAAPMGALLTNSVQQPVPTSYNLVTATNDIYNYGLIASARAYSASQLGPNFCPYAYTMAGEIANTATLTAPTGGSPNKAVTETPIRDIANLVTPRSNTFTIWCLAQSIKQPPNTPTPGTFTPGTDVVTGETKVQAIVERTVDSSSGTPQVKFRTLYYRYYYQ